MKANFIIIGNELLNGKIKDLNTEILAKSLFSLGISLNKVQIIPDEQLSFKEAFTTSLNEGELIFISGGLGPTKDDLTKSFLANFYGESLVENEKAFETAKSHYQRAKREYDKELIHYHLLPTSFQPIYNPIGYAPGIYINKNQKQIFSLPGVPNEFEAMIKEEIMPRFLQPSGKHFKNIIIKTWKIPEAKIFTELCPNLWDELSSEGQVSSLPHIMGVDIGIFIEASTQEEINEKENKILFKISNGKLKEYIWHIGPEQLEEVIIKEAKAKNLKIGFAESCTGGLCASRITNFSGSSEIFWGSIVSYANEVKTNTLGVASETLKNYGAVSQETAEEMAIGALKQLGVDIVVTTTGIAGPGGGSKEKPVGTVGIGVANKQFSKGKIYHFTGNRIHLKQNFSEIALMTLLNQIRSH